MLKILLLTVILDGCAFLPPFPEITQYGIHADITPPGFYGVNSNTHARVYKSFNDSSMKGGQCLSTKDYQVVQEWISRVKEIANTRCR